MPTYARITVRMRASRKILKRNSRRIGFGVLAAVTALGLLLIKLGTLTSNLAPSEKTLAASATTHQILANPAHLPLRGLLWLTKFVPATHQILATRLPSVLLALLALATLTYILHRWYGPRTTVYGFFIFATSAWFLHVGRFNGTEVEYLLAIIALIAVHIGLYDHGNKPPMLYLWLIVNVVLLYIPGLLWFVALSLIWQHKELIAAWRNLKSAGHQVILTLCALLGLIPPILSAALDPALIKSWLGVPDRLASWHYLALQAANTLGTFVYHGPHNPEIWLGRLPILDAFLSLMLIAGIVFYARHWRATRAQMLLGYLVLGVLLVTLAGPVRLSILVPLVYLVAIGGIAYVLHFWLSVFPRNPLARGVGIALVTSVIALSCAYSLDQYFVAWPHNTETRKAYQNSP